MAVTHSGSHSLWRLLLRSVRWGSGCPSLWRVSPLSTVYWTVQTSHPHEPLLLTYKLPHMPGLESTPPMDQTITGPRRSCRDHQGLWWQRRCPSSFSESSLVFQDPPLPLCDFILHIKTYRHLGCFHVLAIVNRAAVNIVVRDSFWIMVFSGYMPSSGIAGS